MGLVFVAEVFEGRAHRVHRALAQAAYRGRGHGLAEVFHEGEMLHFPPAVGDFLVEILELGQAFPAGGALAAGLGVEEADEVAGHIHHAAGAVHDDHAAGAHDGTHLLEAVVIHRQVKELLRDATPRGAAGLHCLEGVAVADAAAQVEDDLPQGHPHGHFHQTRVVHRAHQRKDLGALAVGRAHGGVPLGPQVDDVRHVGPGLDVVDDGREAKKPGLGGVGRPGKGSPM